MCQQWHHHSPALLEIIYSGRRAQQEWESVFFPSFCTSTAVIVAAPYSLTRHELVLAAQSPNP